MLLIAADGNYGMEESKRNDRKIESVGLRTHSGKTQTRQSKTTIGLALEQKALELWEKAWSNEMTGRKLYSTCPKPTKKVEENTHRSLLSGQRLSSTDEDGENRPQEVFAFKKSARL